jgi:hypothetical protein
MYCVFRRLPNDRRFDVFVCKFSFSLVPGTRVNGISCFLPASVEGISAYLLLYMCKGFSLMVC